MSIIAGIDEAGRGSVIGPMVIAGIIIEDMNTIFNIGVKDSKKLSPRKRELLFKKIIDNIKGYHIEVIDAEVIDRKRKYETLNDIEAEAMINIIEKLRPNIVQIGSPQNNAKSFIEKITRKVKNIEIISVYHAEDVFPTVAAASILAKVTRDRIIEKLKKDFGDFGSGYPSDKKTINFIMNSIKNGQIPNIIRKSWKTFSNLLSYYNY
jgi:ribonuclease HII